MAKRTKEKATAKKVVEEVKKEKVEVPADAAIVKAPTKVIKAEKSKKDKKKKKKSVYTKINGGTLYYKGTHYHKGDKVPFTKDSDIPKGFLDQIIRS